MAAMHKVVLGYMYLKKNDPLFSKISLISFKKMKTQR